MKEYLELAKFYNNWSKLSLVIRYILVIAIFIFCSQYLGSFPISSYIQSVDITQLTSQQIFEYEQNSKFETIGLNSTVALIMLIIGFGFGIIGLYLAYRFILKKSFWNLINSDSRIRWKNILFAAGVWAFFMTIQLAITYILHPAQFHFQFTWSSFIPLFFVSIFLLPIQSSFEELIYRGFYLHAISLFSKYPIIPIIATSIMFATMHMLNPEVEAFGWQKMFLYYFGTGLMLAIITILDQGIEMALGIHAMNNIFSALTVTYDDAVIHTDSVWSMTETSINWWDITLFYVMFFAMIYSVYWFRKKNHNNDSKIVEPRGVEPLTS